jgi:hypothetical protein
MKPERNADREPQEDRAGEAQQELSIAMGQAGELVARTREIIAESRAIMERVDKLLPSVKATSTHPAEAEKAEAGKQIEGRQGTA